VKTGCVFPRCWGLQIFLSLIETQSLRRCTGLVQVFAAPELQLAAEEVQRLHSVQESQNLLQYVDREDQGYLPESDKSTT
jgi:hypothetical protein